MAIGIGSSWKEDMPEQPSESEKLRRFREAVANIARTTGKTEEEVLKNIDDWMKETPDQQDLRIWKHALSVVTDPKDKAVFERLIAEKERHPSS